MKRPEWWPDWSGQPAVIVAGGASARDAGIEHARGRARVVAINNAGLSSARLNLHCPGVEPLCPWADALYAADLRWWDCMGGVPEFGGLKVSADHRSKVGRPGIEAIKVRFADPLVLDVTHEVGRGGGQGGFQALNWLAYLGCTPIVLVGFDMVGGHWHGPHREPLNNPEAKHLSAWRAALDAAAPLFAERGIPVLNASPISALTAYPKVTLAEALDVRRAA